MDCSALDQCAFTIQYFLCCALNTQGYTYLFHTYDFVCKSTEKFLNTQEKASIFNKNSTNCSTITTFCSLLPMKKIVLLHRKLKLRFMKRLQIILIGLCMVMSVSASVTLDSCRAWAHANYPAIRQYALIQQSAEYSVSNAARAWIPRVVLSAQATYQSETANMSDVWNAMGLSDILSNWGKDIPDMYMRPLQGKVQVDVHQTIWDGGKAAADKYIAEADRSKQEAQIDVEFYQLDSRVLNVYFGILLLNEQLHQLQRTDTLLRSNLARTRTLYENSIVLASDVDAVEVEVLSLQQKQEQLYYSLTAYREMLSMLVGRDLTREELVLPNEILSESRMPAIETMRPEWRLLSAQSDWIAAQRKSLQSAESTSKCKITKSV